MLKLHDYLPSQNGYKVRMLLAHLGVSYEHVPVAIFRGESRTPDFLGKNPVGAVPVLETATGDYIAESNAILWFLARGTQYLPDAPLAQAKVMQWLFFEQYYVEPYIGTLRYWTLTNRLAANEPLITAKRNGGERALQALERHLAKRPFLANDSYSIADIAVFAFTHLAEQAGFELVAHPGVRAWIARVKQQPGGVPEVYPYDPDALAASQS